MSGDCPLWIKLSIFLHVAGFNLLRGRSKVCVIQLCRVLNRNKDRVVALATLVEIVVLEIKGRLK